MHSHIHTRGRVADLSHRCVQFDVQAFSQSHGNTRVTVPDRQVAARELKVIILQENEGGNLDNAIPFTVMSFQTGCMYIPDPSA